MPIPAGPDPAVGEIFLLTELAAYLQQDLDEATADLARLLATGSIRLVVGRARWAAITVDQRSDLKGIALDIARRLYLNPDLRRSEKIDDYEYTNGTETLAGTKLDDGEEARVRRVFGMGTGRAFTITPAAPATYCSPVRRHHY